MEWINFSFPFPTLWYEYLIIFVVLIILYYTYRRAMLWRR